jgi:hypothetical protein
MKSNEASTFSIVARGPKTGNIAVGEAVTGLLYIPCSKY